MVEYVLEAGGGFLGFGAEFESCAMRCGLLRLLFCFNWNEAGLKRHDGSFGVGTKSFTRGDERNITDGRDPLPSSRYSELLFVESFDSKSSLFDADSELKFRPGLCKSDTREQALRFFSSVAVVALPPSD
jgi:hypothetical protein